jgi:hypothetical protein
MKTRHGRFFAGLGLMLGGEWFFIMLSASTPSSASGVGGFLWAMVRAGLSEPVFGVLLFLDVAAIVAGAVLMVWGVISQNPKIMRAIPALIDLARTNLAPWLRPDAITGPGSSDIQ